MGVGGWGGGVARPRAHAPSVCEQREGGRERGRKRGGERDVCVYIYIY